MPRARDIPAVPQPARPLDLPRFQRQGLEHMDLAVVDLSRCRDDWERQAIINAVRRQIEAAR